MIARFDLHYRRQPQAISVIRKGNTPLSGGWYVVVVLTLLFLGWIVYRTRVEAVWVNGLSPLLSELLRLLELAGGLTLALLWGLLLWRQQFAASSAGTTLEREDLYEMDPVDFEKYVARLFRRKGYQVKMRGRSGDHGVDLELLQPGGKRAIVQCKRYRSQIGPDIARELFGTLIHERAAHAFLVTTADISKATRDWVRDKPITLIDGKTLLEVAARTAICKP